MKSDDPEFVGRSPTTAIVLDSVLDTMTVLAVQVGKLEEVIVCGTATQNAQRERDLTSELSALGLTLAEACRRVTRCHDLCEEQ